MRGRLPILGDIVAASFAITPSFFHHSIENENELVMMFPTTFCA